MNRAGVFITQAGGFKAFVPAPLPPEPPVDLGRGLARLLSDADLAVGRLDGSTGILPNPDLFVGMYVKNEAVLSSQIEGTQASLTDVLQFEAGDGEQERVRDVEEVVNYVAAMKYGLKRVRELPPSLRLIKEIHARLMEGVRGQDRDPGEFRRTQNWIGPAGCTLNGAAFVPPPPTELLRVLGELENFLHDESLPALLQAGLAHAQFETIHPFLDGNGRMGRLLITFLLCQRGALRQPLLYLSHYFKQHRAQYYDRLQAVRLEGDWEGWLRFFVTGVRDVAQEATARAGKIIGLREKCQRVLSGEGKRSGNLLQALDLLFRTPMVTANGLMKELDVTFPTASGIAARLCELEILRENTGRVRNRRFAFQPYLDLFLAPEASSEEPAPTARTSGDPDKEPARSSS